MIEYRSAPPINRIGSEGFMVVDGSQALGQVERAPCGFWVALVQREGSWCPICDRNGWLLRFPTRIEAADALVEPARFGIGAPIRSC